MSRKPHPIPKAAFVTGAGRRIGRAIAEDLAAHGYAVVLHANTSGKEAEKLADAIHAAGGKAAVVIGDLFDPARVDQLLEEGRQAVGPLGILVNCAAIFEPDGSEGVDRASLSRHFAINTEAPVMLAKHFASALPEDADGLVVNVLDQRVLRPQAGHFSYSVSKATLWAATQLLAQVLAPRVRVMGIGPGPVLPHEGLSEEDFAAEVARAPLRHAPPLADFGRTVRYFAETSSVTGQMLALDSGQHLG